MAWHSEICFQQRLHYFFIGLMWHGTQLEIDEWEKKLCLITELPMSHYDIITAHNRTESTTPTSNTSRNFKHVANILTWTCLMCFRDLDSHVDIPVCHQTLTWICKISVSHTVCMLCLLYEMARVLIFCLWKAPVCSESEILCFLNSQLIAATPTGGSFCSDVCLNLVNKLLM